LKEEERGSILFVEKRAICTEKKGKAKWGKGHQRKKRVRKNFL